MRRIFMFSFLVGLSFISRSQGTVSATFTLGDIPTSFGSFDPNCNGNSIILDVTLPGGDMYPVSSIDISYSMIALGTAQIAHQRSQVKCVTTGITEAIVFNGSSAASGTESYNRTSVSIANGNYPGGTKLRFELHAWRTVEIIPGCNSTVNRVNNGTWTITVHYDAMLPVAKVGVNTTAPSTTLDVSGKIKLGNDVTAPEGGMIRWNSSAKDFEGFNGSVWVSMTNKKGDNNGWGDNAVKETSVAYSNDGSANDVLGFDLAIEGNYAIAGAYNKLVGGNASQGKAYIFLRTGSNWNQQAGLLASDGAASDQFGRSVSISGDYAIVGAPNKLVSGNTNRGKAYIFIRSGTIWTQQAMISASDGTTGDRFGSDVSISGGYAVVGAFYKNSFQGKAYVFSRSGTVWTQQAPLLPADVGPSEYFGRGVSIDGDYIAVSASSKTVGSNLNQGKVYVFYRTGTAWNQQATFIASDGNVGEFFGESVCISGDYIIAGSARKIVENNFLCGQAYIFKRDGSQWSEEAILAPGDPTYNGQFGTVVSIKGNIAVVGAFNKAVGANLSQGAAYVFRKNGSTWVQEAKLLTNDGAQQDYFANSVAVDGNVIAAGAPFKTIGAAASQGRLYFFLKK